MNDIICRNNEEFLDFLSLKLIGSPFLTDICYEIVGYRGNALIFEVSGDIYEDPSLYDEENTIRVCSECNKEMTEGYVIDGGLEYYCSDECLHKHYTEEEWLEKYDNGNSDSYWTSWEN